MAKCAVAGASTPVAQEESDLFFSLGSTSESRFTAANIVPNRKQVVTGGRDGAVVVWPMAPAEPPRPLRLGRHKGAVTCVTASRSGNYIASASMDRSVVVWGNSARKLQRWPVKLHFSPVRACDISPDERLLLTASDDKMIKLTSMQDLRFVRSLIGHSHWVRSAVFAPSGGHLAASAGDDRTVRLWDAERGSELQSWLDHTDVVNCVRFDAQGLTLAACCCDSVINLWDTRSQALRQHYSKAHGSASIAQVAFHPEKELLLSVAADTSMRIWDLRAGRLQATFHEGHQNSIHSCAWDPHCSSHFLSADSHHVHIWKHHPQASAGCHEQSHETRAPSSAAAPGQRTCAGEASLRAHPGDQLHPPARAPPLAEVIKMARPPEEDTTLAWTRASVPEVMPTESPAQRTNGSETALQRNPVQNETKGGGAALEEQLAPVVEKMVSQMAVITRSLQAIEARMSSTERAVAELSAMMLSRRQNATAEAAAAAGA
mmetsp:Transcript_59023/g.140949  ORF Transcript_59023/g.140949 Transcript_59023/m.140949 type:complete len:489 (-) Transcript_59023:179-1645(-)